MGEYTIIGRATRHGPNRSSRRKKKKKKEALPKRRIMASFVHFSSQGEHGTREVIVVPILDIGKIGQVMTSHRFSNFRLLDFWLVDIRYCTIMTTHTHTYADRHDLWPFSQMDSPYPHALYQSGYCTGNWARKPAAGNEKKKKGCKVRKKKRGGVVICSKKENQKREKIVSGR